MDSISTFLRLSPLVRNKKMLLSPTLLFIALSRSGGAFISSSTPRPREECSENPYYLPSSPPSLSTRTNPILLCKSPSPKTLRSVVIGDVIDHTTLLSRPDILPAGTPLDSFFTTRTKNNDVNGSNAAISSSATLSVLSWNILLPNSRDNWWCHKMYSPWVPTSARTWKHRQSLIRDRLLRSAADIICIQEADGDTFNADFAFMKDAGYDHVLHKKFRFRCATFYKTDKYVLEKVGQKDRVLVTALRSIQDDNDTNDADDDHERDNNSRIIHVLNCHLSGGAAPERRLRQVHEALEQTRKWKNAAENSLNRQRKAKRPSPKNVAAAEETFRQYYEAGVIVCGDFNSDGNTGVRRLLVEGAVDPGWREELQYPGVQLTSKRREQPHAFVDAAELAYASNVCDGDYGEDHGAHGCRPATYVVPNLASLLLSPVDEDADSPFRTEFGNQFAKGLAATLSLKAFCDTEIEHAFDSVDLDGNGSIDEDEVKQLLGSVYVSLYGPKIEEEKREFFSEFNNPSANGLRRDQFGGKLLSLQKKLDEEESGSRIVGGLQLAKGVTDALGLGSYCEKELESAFQAVDLDGNGSIDEDEIKALLQRVYLATYGKRIEKEKNRFLGRFRDVSTCSIHEGLTLEQFRERLLALQQELEGGSEGYELVEIRTEADAQRMIGRFSPILRNALDYVFDKYCTSKDGGCLSQDDAERFLIRVNGQLGRGGSWRHASAILERKREASMSVVLTRQDWYEVFARELGEGKWWQVVHDLEVCGADLRSKVKRDTLHYQGWLDYIYFDSERLSCRGVQEALNAKDISRLYDHGDALPNEWHPSDHLPVAAVFSWR